MIDYNKLYLKIKEMFDKEESLYGLFEFYLITNLKEFDEKKDDKREFFLKCENLTDFKPLKSVIYYLIGTFYEEKRGDFLSSARYFFKSLKLNDVEEHVSDCLKRITYGFSELFSFLRVSGKLRNKKKSVRIIILKTLREIKLLNDKLKIDALFNLGHMLYEIERYFLAIRIFNYCYRISDTNKNKAYSLYYIGVAYDKLEKYAEASMYYLRSLEFIEEINFKGEILLKLGVAYKKSNKNEKAIKCFDDCIEIFKDEEKNDLVTQAHYYLSAILKPDNN